jgi:hypothetical protein
MALTPAQRAQRRAQQQAQQRAYEQTQGFKIAQYANQFAQGNVGPDGAPVPPPAPVIQPQPFDPAFEAQRQGATWNVQLSDAEAGWQTDRTGWYTGYNADGSLNTSNPYSQAQLFQDNYRRSVTGTNNSMAAQGQLYSGARLNAQARNDRLYAEGSAGIRDAAQDRYHGIGYGRLQTYGANSAGVAQGGFESLLNSTYRR